MNIIKHNAVWEIKKIRGKDENFDDLKFIVKAISKDECRIFLTYFVIEKDRIYSSDGRRLHLLTNPQKLIEIYSFEEGYYKILIEKSKYLILVKIEPEGKFPDVDKLFNVYKFNQSEQKVYKYTGIYANANNYFKSAGYGAIPFLMLLHVKMFVNLNFIYDLGEQEYIAKIDAKERTLFFENDKRKALLMSIDIDQF